MDTRQTIGRTRPYGVSDLQPRPIPGLEPTPVGATGTPGSEARPGRSPGWARISLIGLLAATAAAYFTNPVASGYGNTFYAAAVEAGSKSWKAMFFGSLDPSNFITVDKPPAALWVMDLSARIFGFHTWSVMGPNVLEGVAAVALLYAAVRRVASPAAGLAAGLMLALTPVAALMFRFDNPDALLTLLLVGIAYALTRALERAQTRWVMLAGSLLVFAFLTKMLQGFAILPALALAYLVAAPTPLRRRLLQLLAGVGAVLVSVGWWVAIVALTPAADRPFIDGSPDNSILNLIFGYNGLSRITGTSGGGANFSGVPGLLRLFNDLLGGQAAWLLPAALIGLVAVLVIRWRAPRTDRVRAAAIIWGGWLFVTGALFSYSRGIIHTYYTVALAPAIAALVAIGGYELWSRRRNLWAGAVGAVGTLTTRASPGCCSTARRPGTPSYEPWFSWRACWRPHRSWRRPCGEAGDAGSGRRSRWPPALLACSDRRLCGRHDRHRTHGEHSLGWPDVQHRGQIRRVAGCARGRRRRSPHRLGAQWGRWRFSGRRCASDTTAGLDLGTGRPHPAERDREWGGHRDVRSWPSIGSRARCPSEQR